MTEELKEFKKLLETNNILQGDNYEMSLLGDDEVSVWPIGDHNNIEVVDLLDAYDLYHNINIDYL